MSETKHTPGPWAITREFADEWTYASILGADGDSIVCDVLMPYVKAVNGFIQNEVQAYANAFLIESAPDLLEAAVTALEVLTPMLSPCDPDCDCVLHMLDAAIAKATGAAS